MKNKMLLPVLAVIAVLATVLLVPSSPALLVETPTVLWSSGGTDAWGGASGWTVTVYGVMVAAGVALAIALTECLGRRKMQRSRIALALTSGVFALTASHWLFCALRWGYILNDLWETPWYILQFWKGGYTMYGAILGGLLGAAVFAKAAKTPLAAAMDSVVPGMALLLAVGRAAEHFSAQGMGTSVANEALRMLPFVRPDEWGGVQLPVYIYEALIAAVALTVMLAMGRKASAGRTAETGLILISAAQVMLDSWRGDELIRFGFVRLNMIAAALVLLGIMILRVRRAVKAAGRWRVWTWLRIVLLFIGAGVVIAIEFALDKSTINNTLLYGVMTAAITLMAFTVLFDGPRKNG